MKKDCFLVCFLISALGTGARAQEEAPPPLALPTKYLRPFEKPILDLQAVDRREEVRELREILIELGHPEKAVAALDRRIDRVKQITRNPERRLPRIGQTLQKASHSLSSQITELENPEDRLRLARLLLRIDHDLAPAREALGQVRQGDRWLSPEEAAFSERWIEIQAAIQSARHLPVEVQVQDSGHELIKQLFDRDGHLIEAAGLRIHSPWPPAKTSRVARNLIRAMALSRYLIDGSPIEVPRDINHSTILFTGRPKYRAAIELDLRNRKIDPRMAEIAHRYAAYLRVDGSEVVNGITENHALGGIFSKLSGVLDNKILGLQAQPSLIVGLGNWVLMSLTGAQLPGIAFFDSGELERGTQEADASGRFQRLLRGSGLMGARSWLRTRVRRGDDPPWSRSFEDQVGKVGGEDMLKSTFVAEYLQLRGPLEELLEASSLAIQTDKLANIAAMAKAIGQDYAEFELEWRQWMRGTPGEEESILARVSKSKQERDPRAEALSFLQNIRGQVYEGSTLPLPGLELSKELSQGAEAHAKYLLLHPDQYSKWPEAHEEFTDREGFSAEGCWAAAHSIIDGDSKSPAQSLENWMGTFYHRLPLLHAGLLQIGWGESAGMAVLDAGSVVAELDYPWRAIWPPQEMRDVPTDFVAELPSPFPGEDQSAWGYPITLQLGTNGREGTPVVRMSLHLGAADGPEVPCRFSSPQVPGNGQMVPDRAWCLIPKEKLAAGTVYWVNTEILRDDEEAESLGWWFRTR
ncbi:MAG: hypothetical protein ACYTG5_16505 [Planctomycetota bacterium]|jgi:hypothetical protein